MKTAKLPQKIDDMTSLQEVSAQGSLLVYNYQLSKRIDPNDFKYRFLMLMRPPVCSSMKDVLDFGVGLRSMYLEPDGSVAGDFVTRAVNCTDQAFRSDVGHMMVQSINKSLPIQIDQTTTMQSISASDDSLTYHYVFPHTYAQDVSNYIANGLRATAAKSICDGDTLILVNHGEKIIYEYVGDDGVKAGEITFTAKDCQKGT